MSTVSGCAEPYLIFDCPVCGTHFEGELRVTVEWDLPDGPRPLTVVSSRVRTSACRCVFSRRRWCVEVEPSGGGKASRLVVSRLMRVERAPAASQGVSV